MAMASPWKILAAAAGALLLAGCMHATKTAQVEHFDLGAAPPATAVEQSPAGAGKVLQVRRIEVPAWLAAEAMWYRLEYRDADNPASYTLSDWIAPPATLLEPILQRALAASGRWRAVLGPANPANADDRLHIRLDDFSQHFRQPGQSSGVIDATVTLLDATDGHVVAQRHFRIEASAPSADAAGGAKALAAASHDFAAQLVAWLGSLPAG